MREILFRGKRMKDGAWIEGFYCEFANNMSGEQEHFIQTVKSDGRIDTLYYIDPATVGQYTRLKDKNGKAAFAGDITMDHCGRKWVIFDCPGGFGICIAAEWKNRKSIGFLYAGLSNRGNAGCFNERHTIIGNIHDNPELLEVET